MSLVGVFANRLVDIGRAKNLGYVGCLFHPRDSRLLVGLRLHKNRKAGNLHTGLVDIFTNALGGFDIKVGQIKVGKRLNAQAAESARLVDLLAVGFGTAKKAVMRKLHGDLSFLFSSKTVKMGTSLRALTLKDGTVIIFRLPQRPLRT